MRELAVYYYGKCGRYGYYNLVRNAVCPNCGRKLTQLGMPYLTFIKLDPEERDNLLTQEILAKDPLITNRFLATARAHNARAVVAELKEHVHELELENLKLNETIDWMHQTIWDLLRKTRALEHQLEGLEIRRQKNSSQ